MPANFLNFEKFLKSPFISPAMKRTGDAGLEAGKPDERTAMTGRFGSERNQGECLEPAVCKCGMRGTAIGGD